MKVKPINRSCEPMIRLITATFWDKSKGKTRKETKTKAKAKTNTKTKNCNLGMFDDIWIAEDQVPCNVIFHDEEKTADGQFQI